MISEGGEGSKKNSSTHVCTLTLKLIVYSQRLRYCSKKVLSEVKFFILSSFVYEEKLVSLVSKSNLGAS